MIEGKTDFKQQDQILKLYDQTLPDDDDDKITLQRCGIRHRDTLKVDVNKDGKEYRVQMGDYQSAFLFKPSPKKKRDGVRAKKKHDIAGYFQGAQNTTDKTNFQHIYDV
jgi:hypothetical protein